jgi:hypothetical protein
LRSYNRTFRERIVLATSMRATRVGSFHATRRDEAEKLILEEDHASLEHLASCLSIDEASLSEQMSLMTPGDIQLNFLRGHAHLLSVVFIFPTFLRWPGVAPDARLADPLQLVEWLVQRGWSPPSDATTKWRPHT